MLVIWNGNEHEKMPAMNGGEIQYKFKQSLEAPNSILELQAGRLAVKNHQGEKAAQCVADQTAPRIL